MPPRPRDLLYGKSTRQKLAESPPGVLVDEIRRLVLANQDVLNRPPVYRARPGVLRSLPVARRSRPRRKAIAAGKSPSPARAPSPAPTSPRQAWRQAVDRLARAGKAYSRSRTEQAQRLLLVSAVAVWSAEARLTGMGLTVPAPHKRLTALVRAADDWAGGRCPLERLTAVAASCRN